MGIKLYEHQKEALLKIKNGSILNGGGGSGKSRTGLAYYFVQEGGTLDPYKTMRLKPRDLYIITTAQKRDSLELEGELVPFLMSTDPEKNAPNGNRVYIDSWNNIGKYVNVIDSFFLFDEQRVCGSGAWVKSFLTIAKRNAWILFRKKVCLKL